MLKRLIRRLHFTHLGALLRLRVADPRTRNAPFVLFDDRTWTYTQSYDEALKKLVRVLKRRRRGLSKAQIKDEIAKLSPEHASWPVEMCVSALRRDPRFRLSSSGSVGLSTWESVRVPSQLEIMRQCLQGSKGPVSVQSVQRRFKMAYGATPDRIKVGQLANRFGAVLKGEWLEPEPG